MVDPIAEKMRLERVRRRMRQEDLGELAGCSRGVVGRLERGGIERVSTEVLIKLLKQLGLQLTVEPLQPAPTPTPETPSSEPTRHA